METPDDVTRFMVALASTLLEGAVPAVPGCVPDGWPSSLIPEPPVSTLGGFKRDQNLTAVFLYPTTNERPLGEYTTLLENNGWTHHGHPSQGFADSRISMLRRDSWHAFVRCATEDAAGKSIIVSLSSSEGPSAARLRFPHFDYLTVPRLQSPVGTRAEGAGGSSGGGGRANNGHITHRIHVVTTLSPRELLPVYAAQLADAGWKTGEARTTSDNAVQWLEAADAKGRTWRGLLGVYTNDSVCEVFIYMATAGDENIAITSLPAP